MGGLRRPGEENNVLSAALTALEPSATAALMKTPGSSGLAADAGSGAAAGKPRKSRPSIKALQPDKPPPFTPVPGVPAASSAAATTKPDAVRGARPAPACFERPGRCDMSLCASPRPVA